MWMHRSTRRLEYPHSLSYQDTSLTKPLFSAMPALMSKIEENLQPMKSVLTTSSSVQLKIPFMEPSDSALIAATISSMVASFSSLHVRSTTDTSGVGTRKAMPVSLPLSDGMTLPTALAAPVEAGMMFSLAQRPARQSLPPRDGPSTESWFAVIACTVVIKPSVISQLSCTTLASGARQLVVQLAFETTFWSAFASVWFTPMTNIGASPLGAEMTTFLQPPSRCIAALAWAVNTPVDSHTTSVPTEPQGIWLGSFSVKTLIFFPSTTRQPSSALTGP